MRENFTSGSVGRAPGNRCLYPELYVPENLPTSMVSTSTDSYSLDTGYQRGSTVLPE
jgi:hypothetical protein